MLVNFIAWAININIYITNIYHISKFNNIIDNYNNNNNNNNNKFNFHACGFVLVGPKINNNIGDMHYDAVIATIYLFHLMNVEQSCAFWYARGLYVETR